MELRIPGQGMVILAAALALLAWFFNDPAPGFAALGLLVILLSDALIFLSAAGNAAGKTTLSRTTEERYALKGTVHHISVQIDVPEIPGVKRACKEMLSPAMELISGTAEAEIPSGTPGIRLHYSCRSFVVGRIRPAGVLLTFTDRFFSVALPLTTPKAREPSFLIFPAGTDQKKQSLMFGDQEIDKTSILRGHSVLPYREFTDGDDKTTIDWKLTAKHNTPYVRQYSGTYRGEPFCIVDLPETPDGMDELRELVLRAITGISEHGVLLITAGPNIIRYRRLPLQTGELEAVSADLLPTARLDHLYRFFEPQVLRREIRQNSGILQQCISSLLSVLTSRETMPEFGYLLDSLIQMGHEQDVIVFTTGNGDQSHIGVIAGIASAHHTPCRIVVPQQLLTPQIRQRIVREGISTAEGMV